jgi:hypothetical protein
MPKPAKFPRWATSGAVTEPNEAKKTIGWYPGERPPANVKNWLLKLNYEWLVWFDTLLTTLGIRRVEKFADAAALRAETAHEDGDVVQVTALNALFRYFPSTSGPTDDGVNIIKPADSASGRWLRVGGAIGIADGLATLDSSGNVPESQLPNTSYVWEDNSGGVLGTQTSTGGEFSASARVSVAGCQVGDVLEIEGEVRILADLAASAAGGVGLHQAYLQAGKSGGTLYTVASTNKNLHLIEDVASKSERVGLFGRFTVVEAGTNIITINGVASGTATLSLRGDNGFVRVRRVRP